MTPVTTAKEAIEAAAKVVDAAQDGSYRWQTADAIRAIPVADPVGVAVADDPRVAGLIDAAQSLINRWDGPLWKDAENTAKFIAYLRTAVAAFAPDNEKETTQ